MYLGIDLGTGSVKLMLLGPDGAEHTVSRSYEVSSPHSGWAQIDTDIWLAALFSCIRELPGVEHVKAIGLSGQMHGIVPCSGMSGTAPVALGPAITWADQRAAETLPDYKALSEQTLSKLGNPPSAGMAGPILLWLRDHMPELFAKIDIVFMPKDFIRATLTGDRLTDYSDASGTLLYDFSIRGWYADLLRAIGLDTAQLPQIRAGNSIAGFVSDDAARRFGLPFGIPVAVGAGDTPAAFFGTDLHDPGTGQISIGTAAQIGVPMAERNIHTVMNLNLFEGVRPGSRYRIAAMMNGGLALEWVRRQLGFSWQELYRSLERRGLETPSDLIFIPYLSGERTPHMDPDARGAWIGLSLHHQREDLALAALLGVASTIRLGLATLLSAGNSSINRLRLVGGSARFPFWRKVLAAMLERDLLVSQQTDTSARGAALMAAEAIGERLFPSFGFDCEYAESYSWMKDYFQKQQDLYYKIF